MSLIQVQPLDESKSYKMKILELRRKFVFKSLSRNKQKQMSHRLSHIDNVQYLPLINLRGNQQKIPNIECDKQKIRQKRSKPTKKIAQLIQKQKLFDKQTYYQTLSSNTALIIKNNIKFDDRIKHPGIIFSERIRYKSQKDQQNLLITPKLKQYRKSSGKNHHLITVRTRQNQQDWGFTPWQQKQSNQHFL